MELYSKHDNQMHREKKVVFKNSGKFGGQRHIILVLVLHFWLHIELYYYDRINTKPSYEK